MTVANIKKYLEELYVNKPNRLRHVLGVCETAKKHLDCSGCFGCLTTNLNN